MSDPKVLRWERLTKRQFDEIDRERAVVLVTCSPLEVHGPHLPLGADALEGEGLAERALRFLPAPHCDRVFLKLPFVYTCPDPVPQPGSLAFRPSRARRSDPRHPRRQGGGGDRRALRRAAARERVAFAALEAAPPLLEPHRGAHRRRPAARAEDGGLRGAPADQLEFSSGWFSRSQAMVSARVRSGSRDA
jgi:hypothetical protein